MSTKKLWRNILINFIAWWGSLCILIALEYLFQHIDEPNAKVEIYWQSFGGIAFLISLSSVAHYYYLYVNYFQHKKYLQYILLCLVFALTLTFLDALVLITIDPRALTFREGFWDVLPSSFMRCTMLYTPAAIFYSLIKGNIGLLKRRNELEKQQLQSSVTALKNQLDPHFLFNSLNTIYATAKAEHADKTTACIEELTGLFRYSLEEAGALSVPIEKELAFIDKYLHLQQLRLPEQKDIKINTRVDWDKKRVSIAPMLLLPLIENAYKYGISYQQPSEVNISIIIADRHLHAEITNTDHTHSSTATSTGIGLANVEQRLQLQYTGRHTFTHSKEGSYYKVSLTIDLK